MKAVLQQKLKITVQRLFLDLCDRLQLIDILILSKPPHGLFDLRERPPADPLVIALIKPVSLGKLEMHADAGDQIQSFDGFQRVIVRACPHKFLQHLVRLLNGQDHDRRVRELLSELFHCTDSVHSRHVIIHQDQVRILFLQDLLRCLIALSCQGRPPLEPADLFQCVQYILVVIDRQYLFFL